MYKVAYILHTSRPMDGSSKAFLSILEGVIGKGVQPMVVIPEKNGIYDQLIQLGVDTKVIDHRASLYPPTDTLKDCLLLLPRLIGRIWLNNKAVKQLTAALSQFQPDIVHTNTSVINIGYIASRRLNIPHIWHLREYVDPDYHFYMSRRRYVQQFTTERSHTICITKDVQKHHKLSGWKNSCVIYDGVLPKEKRAWQETKKRYSLYAGRLFQTKGIEDLIDAYAKYISSMGVTHEKEIIPLWIAGESTTEEYRRHLEEKVKRYQIENYIRFLGQRKDILQLMQEAYVTVVPALQEGFGFITAEAMFSGCLVIGKNNSGTKEQLDNGVERTGSEIGLRYETEEELIKILTTISMETLEKYYPMMKAAQKVVSYLYSTESCVEQVVELYRSIISPKQLESSAG